MNILVSPAISLNALASGSCTLPDPLRINHARKNQLDRSCTEKMKSRIKLLLVDDHPIVRKGISSCLARQERLTIVGEAADGLEAVRKAKELSPDIILMDIDMPRMNGLAVTELLRRELPDVKVSILSMPMKTRFVLHIRPSRRRRH